MLIYDITDTLEEKPSSKKAYLDPRDCRLIVYIGQDTGDTQPLEQSDTCFKFLHTCIQDFPTRFVGAVSRYANCLAYCATTDLSCTDAEPFQLVIQFRSTSTIIHSIEDLNEIMIPSRVWCLMHNGRRVNDLLRDLKRKAVLSNDTVVMTCNYMVGGGRSPKTIKQREDDAKRKRESRVAMTDEQKEKAREKANEAKKNSRAVTSAQQKEVLQAKDKRAHSKGREAMSEEQKKLSQAHNSLAHSKAREAMSEEQKMRLEAQDKSNHKKMRVAMSTEMKAASQARDTSAHARQAAKGHMEKISEKEFLEWTREDTEEKGTGAKADLYFANFTQDLLKSQLLFHINGGHDYFPSYERIPHGHPDMAAETWTDPEQIDQGLRDLQKAMAAEVIDDEFKIGRAHV